MYPQQRGVDTYPWQNTWKKPELISQRHFHAVKACQVRKWIYKEKSFPVILRHKSMSQSCSDGMEASFNTTVITYWFRVSSGSVHLTGVLLSQWLLVCPIMCISAFGKTWRNDWIVFHMFAETMAVSETGGRKYGYLRTSHPDRTPTCHIGQGFWENTATLALKDKWKGQFFCRWFDHYMPLPSGSACLKGIVLL